MLPLESALDALEDLILQLISDDERERYFWEDGIRAVIEDVKGAPNSHEPWQVFADVCEFADSRRQCHTLLCFGTRDGVEITWRFSTRATDVGRGKVKWRYEFGHPSDLVGVKWNIGRFSQGKPSVIHAITNEQLPGSGPGE
jgi:hypothetical protein